MLSIETNPLLITALVLKSLPRSDGRHQSWAESSDNRVCLGKNTGELSYDVTWLDLFPCSWQDGDLWESLMVGPWLEQIWTAGCGVLCAAVTHIKQPGVPVRPAGAAGSWKDWRWSVTQISPSFVFAAHLTSRLVFVCVCVCGSHTL